MPRGSAALLLRTPVALCPALSPLPALGWQQRCTGGLAGSRRRSDADRSKEHQGASTTSNRPDSCLRSCRQDALTRALWRAPSSTHRKTRRAVGLGTPPLRPRRSCRQRAATHALGAGLAVSRFPARCAAAGCAQAGQGTSQGRAHQLVAAIPQVLAFPQGSEDRMPFPAPAQLQAFGFARAWSFGGHAHRSQRAASAPSPNSSQLQDEDGAANLCAARVRWGLPRALLQARGSIPTISARMPPRRGSALDAAAAPPPPPPRLVPTGSAPTCSLRRRRSPSGAVVHTLLPRRPHSRSHTAQRDSSSTGTRACTRAPAFQQEATSSSSWPALERAPGSDRQSRGARRQGRAAAPARHTVSSRRGPSAAARRVAARQHHGARLAVGQALQQGTRRLLVNGGGAACCAAQHRRQAAAAAARRAGVLVLLVHLHAPGVLGRVTQRRGRSGGRRGARRRRRRRRGQAERGRGARRRGGRGRPKERR